MALIADMRSPFPSDVSNPVFKITNELSVQKIQLIQNDKRYSYRCCIRPFEIICLSMEPATRDIFFTLKRQACSTSSSTKLGSPYPQPGTVSRIGQCLAGRHHSCDVGGPAEPHRGFCCVAAACRFSRVIVPVRVLR